MEKARLREEGGTNKMRFGLYERLGRTDRHVQILSCPKVEEQGLGGRRGLLGCGRTDELGRG